MDDFFDNWKRNWILILSNLFYGICSVGVLYLFYKAFE